MVTVSVTQLVQAIKEADVYKLPEMNDGVSYLYYTIYRRLSGGHDVRLSEIDFGAFEAEDVDTFSEIYSDVFERNHYTANSIASTLRSVAPAGKAVAYV